MGNIAVKNDWNFNPRAPRGARPKAGKRNGTGKRFQSTRSARSATKENGPQGDGINISIHALREERDAIQGSMIGRRKEFQSTRSARSATTKFAKIIAINIISIHALREERDSKKTQNRRAFFVINIEYYESFR